MKDSSEVEEWSEFTEEEKWARPRDWYTADGVWRDRKIVSRGDRWCKTGRAILQAVREVCEEDNQR